MSGRRILLVAVFAILLALVWARTIDAHSALGDRYPADAAGVVHVPAIDAIAEHVAGRPFPVDCVPDPHDGDDARTLFDEDTEDDGVTWTAYPPASTQLNGALCGALEPLVVYRRGFFHRNEVAIVSVTPILKPTAVTIWGENRTEKAAGALLDVVHEAEHAALFGPVPRIDDGALAAFDEGVTECAAMRRMPEVIGSLGLPDWLSRNVLAAATWRHQESSPDELTVC